MFINTLILAFSTSIDAIGIGITYGLRNIKFSFLSKLVFFLVSLTSTSLSILLGNFFKLFLPAYISSIIGSLLIIFIGFYAVLNSFKSTKNFDYDNSNTIDNKEALALSLSLTADSLCVGIGSTILNVNVFLFPFFVATLHLSFITFGNFLGKNLINISKVKNNIWSIISGILLITIGICKLF